MIGPLVALLALALAGPQTDAGAPAAPQVCEAKWHDSSRNRDVPVRIRLPAGTGRIPLILFSHGLGGSLDAGTVWAEAWVKDGNAVIHLQHPGSDSAILRDGGLRQAMSAEQLRNRAGDVRFVIDEVGRRPREGACDLRRIDLGRIGMAGHSFGAQTTLAVAGTTYRAPQGRLSDPRVRAAIALSPQPATGQPDAIAFGTIRIPFLSITGTKDSLPWLNDVTPADRERPFRSMASGAKYLLVLRDGRHADFSGQADGGLMRGASPPRIVETVVRATILFWRATLHGDAAARTSLDGFAATLPPGERFERR